MMAKDRPECIQNRGRMFAEMFVPTFENSSRFARSGAGKGVFHPQDFRVQLSSELLAVSVALAQVIEMHRRLNGALAKQVHEMRHKRHILPVTNLFAHIAVA